jgi:hypothetical protein
MKTRTPEGLGRSEMAHTTTHTWNQWQSAPSASSLCDSERNIWMDPTSYTNLHAVKISRNNIEMQRRYDGTHIGKRLIYVWISPIHIRSHIHVWGFSYTCMEQRPFFLVKRSIQSQAILEYVEMMCLPSYSGQKSVGCEAPPYRQDLSMWYYYHFIQFFLALLS